MYQITDKLLQLSVDSWQQKDEKILIKTWATGHYANLCVSIPNHKTIETLYTEESLSGIKELLEENQAILKVTARKGDKSSIVWVSFPY